LLLKIANYCFYQYAAHLKNATFFSNIKILFLSAIYNSLYPCIHLALQKAAILKTAATIDGIAPRHCTDEAGCVVCNALTSRTLETDNTYCNQKLLCEVLFLS
jgi:hypothetical protein